MQTTTTARDIMRHEFIGVSESDTLADAASLLTEEESDSIIVLRGNDPVGRLTVHDMLEALLEGDPVTRTVGTLVRENPVIVTADAALSAVRERFFTDDTSSVLVVNGNGPIGVVTERDLLLATGEIDADEFLSEHQPTEREQSTDAQDEFGAHHSICEVCGSLSAALGRVNGQMRCPDCIEV